jgi:hypothetical protein
MLMCACILVRVCVCVCVIVLCIYMGHGSPQHTLNNASMRPVCKLFVLHSWCPRCGVLWCPRCGVVWCIVTIVLMRINAQSVRGVAYALETLSQVLSSRQCSAFAVTDGPRFPHRGIMIDTGRRFYPVALVKNILDGMAMVKMNVLHFHLSEECFRVQASVACAVTLVAAEWCLCTAFG